MADMNILAYLRTPVTGTAMVVDQLVQNCATKQSFGQLATFTETLPLPDKLSFSIACNGENTVLKGDTCGSSDVVILPAKNPAETIYFHYCEGVSA